MFKNGGHAPSFKVIVSWRYKPSLLILNFFKLILKTYTGVVSNRITIFQDWAHESFICCLFYLLWTRVKISSQEAKGPISLSANMYMCISSQIIWDSDPRILDTFDIFEDLSFKSGSFLSASLLFELYCIWQVEISYPISMSSIPIDLYLSEVSMCPLYP